MNKIEESAAGAASPATAPEPAGFMAFGSHNDGAIPLPGYCNETELGVKSLILDAARREGYKGTVAGRMLDLGWWIEPVYRLATPSPTGATVPGVLTDEQRRSEFYEALDEFTANCGHKPSMYDIWLIARGAMDTQGRNVAPPSAHREQA